MILTLGVVDFEALAASRDGTSVIAFFFSIVSYLVTSLFCGIF